MATYNRAYVIEQSINSIRAQTYPHWELVLMDDGSTDNTAQVVRAINDPRIKYHHQPNAGPQVGRNHALELTTGEWITYLDSDDAFRPLYLATMLAHFHAQPRATFGSPKLHFVVELYKDSKLIANHDKTNIFPDHLTLQDIYYHECPFYTGGFMHQRWLFEKGARFDPNLPGKEDWDLVMQMGELDPNGYLYVPEVLIDYYQRYGADARSQTSYAVRADKLEAIWRKHRFDRLMRGQTWYPAEAEAWRDLERKLQAGQVPPPHLFEFPELWPKTAQPVYNRPL